MIDRSPQHASADARRAVALLLLINLFNYIDRYVLAAVEPLIQADFFPKAATDDRTATMKMGLLATAFLVSYLLLAPVFGWLADRWKRWAIVGIGVCIWSVASGASGWSHMWSLMLLMRIFVGVGEAAYGPTAPTLISDLFPVERRGAILAWFYAAIPVGSALGYVLGGAISKLTTWHWAFIITLPPGILLGVLCFLMKDPPRGAADKTSHRAATFADYLTLFKIPSYVLSVAGMTAFTFAIGGISFWMPKYLHTYRGQTDLGHVSLVFGAITAVAGLGATLIGGWLGDALKPKYSGSYFLVSGGGMIAGFPFFIASLYAPMPWAYVFIFLGIFFLFLSTGPSNAILANVTHPSIRATGFAVCIFLIHAFGDAISPPVIGLVTDLTKTDALPDGDMTKGFLVVGGMILLSGILWLWGTIYLARDTELAPTRLAGKAPSPS
ncbi:MAG: MFS transporter [Phycisphaerales bacterium]|nr:MFS transporter [Planctomycetota bacterium]